MSTAPRLLFPDLPPELRTEVYKHLSTDESQPATTTGLPFHLKAYECKHTTLQFCPAHTGSPALLSLSNYNLQESREYAAWLLDNAVQLRIAVHFKGRVSTFVQADWDKKVTAHLRKLARTYPWLAKVAAYEVRVTWAPVDGVLKGRKKGKTEGRIVRDMVGCLTGMMDQDVRRKRGDVRVLLRLAHCFAVEGMVQSTGFGFEDFWDVGTGNVGTLGLEVWKEKCAPRVERDDSLGTRFVSLAGTQEKWEGLLIDRGIVSWAPCWGTDQLVLRKRMEPGIEVEFLAGHHGADKVLAYMLGKALEACGLAWI